MKIKVNITKDFLSKHLQLYYPLFLNCLYSRKPKRIANSINCNAAMLVCKNNTRVTQLVNQIFSTSVEMEINTLQTPLQAHGYFPCSYFSIAATHYMISAVFHCSLLCLILSVLRSATFTSFGKYKLTFQYKCWKLCLKFMAFTYFLY